MITRYLDPQGEGEYGDKRGLCGSEYGIHLGVWQKGFKLNTLNPKP